MHKIILQLLLIGISNNLDSDIGMTCYYEYFLSVSNQIYESCYYAVAVGPVWDENGLLTSAYDSTCFCYTGSFSNGGWNRCDSDYLPGGPCSYKYCGALGRGLYKIYTSDFPYFKFYLDTRDCNIPLNYSSHDIELNYDAESQYQNWTCNTLYPLCNFFIIDTFEILKFWELKGYQSNCQTCFQPITPTNLRYENHNGRPRLVWDLSALEEAATYEIWRRVSSNPPKYQVVVEDWRCIQSLPAGTTAWTDNEFQISGTTNRADYKIRAVSGDGHLFSPSFSNVVVITGTFLPFDKRPSAPVALEPARPSFSAFPNPFNRTISINLCAPTAEMTEITIYDLQGRTVKTSHPTPDSYYFDTI